MKDEEIKPINRGEKYNRDMKESYYTNRFWSRRFIDDYSYCSENIDSVLDKVSEAINKIREERALPELYKKLEMSEKKLLMELILNDSELL